MTEIPHLGCKLLLARRMFVATASSIVVQFIFMSCVILITNLSITHPLSWIQDTWSMVTCLRVWCYFVVLAAVIVLQGVICSKTYLTVPPYRKSRFDALCGMFTPHNFLVGGLHIAIGVVLVWLHLSLEDGEYGSLTTRCKTRHGYCLVEEHYFLLLGGLWTGIYHFARTNFLGLGYLEFSLVPRSKFLQVKQGIGHVLPSAATGAIWPALYLLGLYYFLGAYLQKIVTSSLFLGSEGEPLNTISRLFNISLIFHTWLYAALFVLTMNSMHLLFQACLTEWIPFEMNQRSPLEDESPSITLVEALAMDKIPIMQHLGYLDLVTLAQKDKSRRAELFALSQPGGHPYNWNCIVEKCLTLVGSFTAEINGVCSAKHDAAHRSVVPKSTVEVLDKTYAYHMRNLVDTRTTCNEIEATKQDTTSGEQFVVGYLRNKRENFVSYLLSKPLIFYFFGRQSDSKIRHVLTNGQTVVWATEAISSLAVASINEDPYGIAQKDLPSIVVTLLSLKQALDKLQKTNLLMRKPQNDDGAIRMILTSLRMAVRRSIYRIVSTFRDYIEDLALEPAVRDELQSFLVYRE